MTPEPKIPDSIEVRKLSVREFCEHVGIEDWKRFIGIEVGRDEPRIRVFLEKDNGTDERDIPSVEFGQEDQGR